MKSRSIPESYSIGIDEVGRGALAGPVVVCAVAVTSSQDWQVLAGITDKPRDSKKTPRAEREKIAAFAKQDFPFGIGEVSNLEIDAKGLAWALREAATQAIRQVIEQLPDGCELCVQADAGLFHFLEAEIPTKRTVKGDEKILEILLASHIAKVYRDDFMRKYAQSHDRYGWETNVGYGSLRHRDAIVMHGLSPLHRKSFCTRILKSVR